MNKLIRLCLAAVSSFVVIFNATIVNAQSQKQSTATLNKEQHVAMLRDQALNGNLAYEILESLTTEVGPRMAGTPQDTLAVKWAVAKLNALGFDKVWKEPVEYDTWVRGVETAQVLAPFKQALKITALGFSVGTKPSGISAEVVHFKTLEDLKNAPKNAAKGKIVFISKRMDRHIDGRGYGEAVGARSSGSSEAAKKGAVALIIRSIGTDSHRVPHTGMMRYQEGVKQIPAAALSNPDADLLERIFERKKPVKLKLTLGAHKGKRFISHNVIGEITGSELPHQKVVIGGHLDSWDLGTGAVDDGAGVALTMAAAKIIGDSAMRPKRTIRVVLFANEEQGLVGAKAYAKAHSKDLANHMTGAESDFGAGRIYAMSSNVDEDNLAMVEKMAKLLKPIGIEYKNNQAGPGPDLIPMFGLGMSVFRLHQDGTDYFDLHHTADDTLDKVDPESLAQNVAAYVVFAYIAADSDKIIKRGTPLKKQ
jgi:carboxypeptidase Q